MNWTNFKEVAFLVIGALLVFALFAVDDQLDTNGRNSDGGRSLVCLQLKAQGQPVEQYEPCMRPSVYKLWKDEPITSLSQRLCEAGTKTEGCEDIGR